MREAQTNALIVDLRNNVGGWALSADILIYFLCGKEALLDLYRETNLVTERLAGGRYLAGSSDPKPRVSAPDGRGRCDAHPDLSRGVPGGHA